MHAGTDKIKIYTSQKFRIKTFFKPKNPVKKSELELFQTKKFSSFETKIRTNPNSDIPKNVTELHCKFIKIKLEWEMKLWSANVE